MSDTTGDATKRYCRLTKKLAIHMQQKEKAPLLGSWKRWYLLLVMVLVLLIIFFSWFTKYFS
ncbi:hypothetical protein I5907_03040 [Panacibacter sp. DH6]|uniref:Uncharacterized protein n=1 Tax=Panacibacter microcysteis TaxID=2793269 RepID=A0A931GUA8_9BACT|nr:hypothetical protein [Panacibacter microcysteis]MBG9375190.1 hypothetical protein [Panacibacter microcysteis]